MAAPNRAQFPRADFIALLLVTLFAVVNFGRCLFVDNAVVFQDEYLYKVLANRFVSQDQVLERHLATPMPNRLYRFVYAVASEFGANNYLGARFLNVVFWAVGLWALYRLAQLTGLSDGRALAFLCAAALLPLSAYAQYFMPESMFFSFFCVATCALLTGVLRSNAIPLVLAGAVMGLMYFIKPHAAVLIAATTFFLLLLPHRRALVLRYGLGVIVIVAVGKVLVAAPGGVKSSLGPYGFFLSNMMTTLNAEHGIGKALFEVAAGHSLFLFTAFGLSALLSLSVLVPGLKLREVERPVSVELQRLTLFLLISSVALVGMSIGFTALVHETGRIHSRYYSFLYPLALLALFHLPSVRFSTAGKLLGVLLGLTLPGLMAYFGPGYSWMLYMSLVPDGPEWGFVFLSSTWCYALLGGLGLTAAWTVLQPRRSMLFICVLCLSSVVSSHYVTLTQKSVFRGPYTTQAAAVTVETFLGREAMNTAIVIGENWDVVTKFLFFLTTAPFVKEAPVGSSLGELIAGRPEITTLISLSDSYVLPPELRCTLQLPGVKVCQR